MGTANATVDSGGNIGSEGWVNAVAGFMINGTPIQDNSGNIWGGSVQTTSDVFGGLFGITGVAQGYPTQNSTPAGSGMFQTVNENVYVLGGLVVGVTAGGTGGGGGGVTSVNGATGAVTLSATNGFYWSGVTLEPPQDLQTSGSPTFNIVDASEFNTTYAAMYGSQGGPNGHAGEIDCQWLYCNDFNCNGTMYMNGGEVAANNIWGASVQTTQDVFGGLFGITGIAQGYPTQNSTPPGAAAIPLATGHTIYVLGGLVVGYF
jgi:hypothetical protein